MKLLKDFYHLSSVSFEIAIKTPNKSRCACKGEKNKLLQQEKKL